MVVRQIRPRPDTHWLTVFCWAFTVVIGTALAAPPANAANWFDDFLGPSSAGTASPKYRTQKAQKRVAAKTAVASTDWNFFSADAADKPVQRPRKASYGKRSHAAANTVKADEFDFFGGATSTKPVAKGRRVASLGSSSSGFSDWGPSLSGGGGVRSAGASMGCVPGELQSALSGASAYGRIVVSSTHRGHAHNASVGGAPQSLHLSCRAVDFRVHGNAAAATAYLRSHPGVGGFKHYGGGLYHIDNGPRRSW